MILRPDYIEAVKPFMDAPLVKILTGVRRCGKSTIFEMIRQELLERGIPEDHIAVSYTHLDVYKRQVWLNTMVQSILCKTEKSIGITPDWCSIMVLGVSCKVVA